METTVIGIFGFFGNLLTIIIFNRKELRSTFHASLSVLALFDLGFLFVIIFDTILQLVDLAGPYKSSYPDSESEPNKLWIALYPYVLWPFENIFMTASIYMTVVISVDRYSGTYIS